MEVDESNPMAANPSEVSHDSAQQNDVEPTAVEEKYRSYSSPPSQHTLEEGNEDLNTPSTEHTDDADDLVHRRAEAQNHEHDPTTSRMVVENVDKGEGGTLNHENHRAHKKRKNDEEVEENATQNDNGSSNEHKRHRVSMNDDPQSKDSRSHQHQRASKKKHPWREDKKGLADAVWDRLMDLQTGNDFRVAQVSRAALSSVGALPEYAQLSIVARFCRTPMKDLRDKNGHLLTLLKEYQKENPLVLQLQPVSSYVDDFDLDPGLFDYGYAPPVPISGMARVPVPYHNEDDPSDFKHRSHREACDTRMQTDEFGRNAVGSVGDSRRSRSRPDNDLARSSKPTDPRRRNPSTEPRPNDQPRVATPADPRRRSGTATGRTVQGLRQSDRTEIYERLPRSIRDVFDKMYNDGRLREVINDSVLSRLLKLPEQVSLQAAENFSNVDLTNIDNLQGFLVGIINRVNERNLVAEAQESHTLAQQGRHGSYGNDRGNERGGSRFRARHDFEPTDFANNFAGVPAQDQQMGYSQPQTALTTARVNSRQSAGRWSESSAHHEAISALPPSVQNHLQSMVENGTLTSIDEFGEKCYEVLGQLSEGLANEVLRRFTHANLGAVRNRSGFLIGVVKRCRQEYGFN